MVFTEAEMRESCKEFLVTLESELYSTASDPRRDETGVRDHVKEIARDIQTYLIINKEEMF